MTEPTSREAKVEEELNQPNTYSGSVHKMNKPVDNSAFFPEIELSLGMNLDLSVGDESSLGLMAPTSLEELVDFLGIGGRANDANDFPLETTFGIEDRWPI